MSRPSCDPGDCPWLSRRPRSCIRQLWSCRNTWFQGSDMSWKRYSPIPCLGRRLVLPSPTFCWWTLPPSSQVLPVLPASPRSLLLAPTLQAWREALRREFERSHGPLTEIRHSVPAIARIISWLFLSRSWLGGVIHVRRKSYVGLQAITACWLLWIVDSKHVGGGL